MHGTSSGLSIEASSGESWTELCTEELEEMEESEIVELRNGAVHQGMHRFRPNAVKVLVDKYRPRQHAAGHQGWHLCQSVHRRDLSDHVSISLQLRDPHVVRLLKVDAGEPLEVGIHADPLVWR